jgi:hypothetical protein
MKFVNYFLRWIPKPVENRRYTNEPKNRFIQTIVVRTICTRETIEKSLTNHLHVSFRAIVGSRILVLLNHLVV